MDKYQKTFKTWDKLAKIYEDIFMEIDLYDKTYDAFCELIKNDQTHLLEIGCGPGNVTKYLLTKRPDFNILATDISQNMVDRAKINNPKAHFKKWDARNILALQAKFDSILAGFCMPYLSMEDVIKLLDDSYQILNTGGYIYLSFIEGDYSKSGYESGSTMDDQVYVYYHSEDLITNQLNLHNFDVVKRFCINYKKQNGITDDHIIIIAKRN